MLLMKFFMYGILGCFGEILWTSLHVPVLSILGHLRMDWRLQGQTYLWMVPIYGAGGFAFESLHSVVVTWNWGIRGLAYMLMCFVGEYIAGWIIRAVTGKVPWDYSQSRFAVHGLIRLDYAPVWFVIGLITETTERIVNAAAPAVQVTLFG